MTPHRSRRLPIVAVLSVLTVHAVAASSRYVVAVDPASRYHFKYVRDQKTGRWIHREFEIRVDLARELPDLAGPSETGSRLSVQLFKPGSAQTGGIFSVVPALEDGFRVWRGADVPDKADLDGKVAYGVSVSWPQTDAETKYDPMEVFPMPRVGDTIPGQWSRWATASQLRGGAMGWWDLTVGNPATPAPAPAHPFELRWRLVYAEIPGRIP